MKDLGKCPFICAVDAGNFKRIDVSPEYMGWDDFKDFETEESISILRECFKIERLDNGAPKMCQASQGVIKFLDDWLKALLSSENSCGDMSRILDELFRSLRNCSSNIHTQNYVTESTTILESCKALFQSVYQSQSCIKMLLQFLLNLISSNEGTTKRIYQLFYDDIRTLFRKNICLYECSALLYNISLFVSIDDQETVQSILDFYAGEQQNEFLCFFLENSISSAGLWTLYLNLRLENRLKILDMLKEMLIQDRLQELCGKGLEILMQKFLECGEIIFQISENHAQEAYEISSALEILSSLSSKEEYLRKLQDRKDVLVNAGALLLNIHRLGKLSDNSFTPIQKLSENGCENQQLNSEPVFGFKADLVRLIGNMCWKNTELQNLARTTEIIPVILDSCNIDAKNPFIMQWCILAVRNLCENNIENQKVIAGLHREGTVSNEVLDEMGITLHSDGDKQLKIVNLESLRK